LFDVGAVVVRLKSKGIADKEKGRQLTLTAFVLTNIKQQTSNNFP
jgi:hypothetical protein